MRTETYHRNDVEENCEVKPQSENRMCSENMTVGNVVSMKILLLLLLFMNMKFKQV